MTGARYCIASGVPHIVAVHIFPLSERQVTSTKFFSLRLFDCAVEKGGPPLFDVVFTPVNGVSLGKPQLGDIVGVSPRQKS